MQCINKFSIINIEKYKLYISLLKNEYNYSILGILKNNDEIIEYCETIDMTNYSDVLKIYDILRDNIVFPSHFYNVIDDIIK